MIDFAEIENRIHAIRDNPQSVSDPAGDLLTAGERVLENWLESHDLEPTDATHEGFRLLALHRQGAINDPSFLACRETCRELVYQVNVHRLDRDNAQINIIGMVALHLLYFVRGKLEEQQLGEFCCSSKSLRTETTHSLSENCANG